MDEIFLFLIRNIFVGLVKFIDSDGVVGAAADDDEDDEDDDDDDLGHDEL